MSWRRLEPSSARILEANEENHFLECITIEMRFKVKLEEGKKSPKTLKFSFFFGASQYFFCPSSKPARFFFTPHHFIGARLSRTNDFNWISRKKNIMIFISLLLRPKQHKTMKNVISTWEREVFIARRSQESPGQNEYQRERRLKSYERRKRISEALIFLDEYNQCYCYIDYII